MKKKVAVLFSQVPFFTGGAELQVNSLICNLKRRGYDADLVQIPYKWYPKASLYDCLLTWRLLDLSESNGEKIDLVIGTKFPSYGVRHDNKVIWLIHQYRQVYDLYHTSMGLSQDKNGVEIRKTIKKYDDSTLNEAKLLYAISKNVADRLKKFNNIGSEPLYHPPSLAGRYFCNDYQNYILSVGRLDKLKRIDLLISALSHCDSSIRVKIAGKGAELEYLQMLAEKLKVQDRVDFLGFVPDEDLLELYANAFAVYFAPIDEDYGYITLEAFLSRKPVITCTDSGGVLEFVEDGRNGCVCHAQGEHIGAAIQGLHANKKDCGLFGEHGYNRVKDINWDNVIDKLTQTIR